MNKHILKNSRTINDDGELQGLLKIMDMEKVKLLHVHSVRWLSMGQVMTRFAYILPILLTLFRFVMFFSLSFT
jgi:hypothetical protein